MDPRSHSTAAALLLALLAATLGCRGPQQAAEAWQPGSVVDPATLEPGRSVERHLETRVRPDGDEASRDVLELELWNTSGAAVEFAYTIEWLDRHGRTLPQEPVWRSLRLEPGGSVPLRVAVPGPEAESWRLRALARS